MEVLEMFRGFVFGSVRCLSTKHAVEKNAVETLRSRLYYQSKKRGILENDILLGGFADSKLNGLSESELREYDKIINGEHMEWDLYYFVTGLCFKITIEMVKNSDTKEG